MKITNATGGLLCLAGMLLLGGCAGGNLLTVRVDRIINRPPENQPIIVRPFRVNSAQVLGDKSNVESAMEGTKDRVKSNIQSFLIEELQNAGFNAMAYNPKARPPKDGLLLDGIVRKIDNGSTAARFWVGMGAGSATIIATIRITRSDNNKDVLAEFDAAGSTKGEGGWSAYTDSAQANSQRLAKAVVKNYFMRKPAAGEAR
ncbi:MAG: hypothetical protein COT18_08915 [Elusimicrobia bacterium CG08_land_8_20_14_0_20_59_10]|nr:MAG: hypothetical protein COT18_08915 [Elusimicrobia bacterium CG08_land_8_20_14_0_20_59_10]